MLFGLMRRAALAALALALAGTFPAGQAARTDVSGMLSFDVQTDAGSGTPPVTWKHDGEKHSRHCSWATLGEVELTGTVEGADIALALTAHGQGLSLPVSFSGAVDSPTT